MYNTVFWALVLQGKRTEQEAEQELRVRPSSRPSSPRSPRADELSPRAGHDLEPEAGDPLLAVRHQLQQPRPHVPQGEHGHLGGRACARPGASPLSLSLILADRQLTRSAPTGIALRPRAASTSCRALIRIRRLDRARRQAAPAQEAAKTEAAPGHRARGLDRRLVVDRGARQGPARRLERAGEREGGRGPSASETEETMMRNDTVTDNASSPRSTTQRERESRPREQDKEGRG